MTVADWWASARPPPYPPPQAGEGNKSRWLPGVGKAPTLPSPASGGGKETG